MALNHNLFGMEVLGSKSSFNRFPSCAHSQASNFCNAQDRIAGMTRTAVVTENSTKSVRSMTRTAANGMETYCKHDDSRLNYAFTIKCKKKMEMTWWLLFKLSVIKLKQIRILSRLLIVDLSARFQSSLGPWG